MYYWKRSTIVAAASVGGGILFTLLSGLYIVKPFILDAEIAYFGFPIAWLEATRSTWVPKPPLLWHYSFLWHGFIIDFVIYGLLAATATGIYLTPLRKIKKRAV